MPHLNIDIETYSSADISDGGVYKYAEAPDFEVLMIAYSYDDGPIQIIDDFTPIKRKTSSPC